MLSLTKFNPESARWLLTKERYNDAADSLKLLAKVNGVPIPDNSIEFMDELKQVGEHLQQEANVESSGGIKPLLVYPRIRRTFCLITLAWIGTSFAYYGLMLNAINLHGNEFINFFLMAIIELPGYFIAWSLMESHLGRRWSMTISLGLCGFFLVLPAFYPTEWSIMTLIVTMGAKVR